LHQIGTAQVHRGGVAVVAVDEVVDQIDAAVESDRMLSVIVAAAVTAPPVVMLLP